MSFYRFSEEEVQDILKRLDDISLTLKQKQRSEPDQVCLSAAKAELDGPK